MKGSNEAKEVLRRHLITRAQIKLSRGIPNHVSSTQSPSESGQVLSQVRADFSRFHQNYVDWILGRVPCHVRLQPLEWD